jgi:LytTr DNA-binding domain
MTMIGTSEASSHSCRPVIRPLIRLANRPAVQLRWDGWLHPRDEPAGARASGPDLRANGDDHRLPPRAIYPFLIGMIIVVCALNAMSEARDIAGRVATPHNFWEPAMWQATSAVVVVALLPLARIAASLIRPGARQAILAALVVPALAFLFAAIHVIGIGLLRELVYRLGGWAYTFQWSIEVPYEMRRDLFLVFPGFVLFFWLAARLWVIKRDKAAGTREVCERPAPEFWLRDGRISVLIDASEIVSVTSAGNYVEYRLTGDRTHLIRATLQAQEARLTPFGIARVHRTRLVNLNRIVALEWRQSGDFEIRLDTGETVACSRRFKSAVAAMAH